MYLIGYDIGSSSVKACLLDAANGNNIASAFFPKKEMTIEAPQAGWAEQHPEKWWEALKAATDEILAAAPSVDPADIKAIGISYQMHGLVLVDKDHQVLRPSIIWCDSRAVVAGGEMTKAVGEEKALSQLLNTAGNFTAAKLKWVKDNEPQLFDQIHKAMLPGDYIAMKLTGEINTTIGGLSEGVFWDFENKQVAEFLLNAAGIPVNLLPPIVDTFGEQGQLSVQAAEYLGLHAGTKVTYRAGDQPNNALSLNVLNPGEIAATAGTSGVVYGVSGETKYDPQSRVNTFAHVNYTTQQNNLGILLCINGTGILYSWARKNLGGLDYNQMNELASASPVGAKGLTVLPFGNGAERVLGNKEIGCHFSNISFNIHDQKDLLRAIIEGIVFSLNYGIEVMAGMGMAPKIIRAGRANLFLSPLFRQTLATIANTTIELYDTDGAQGAARGAGIGLKNYTAEEAFVGLTCLETIRPDLGASSENQEAYRRWKQLLDEKLL